MEQETSYKKQALIIVDVHDRWATSNPDMTKKILDFIESMRGQMEIVWVYKAASVDLPLSPYEPATLREKFNILNERYRLVVEPHKGDLMMTKAGMDGYNGTTLAEDLKAKGITEHYYVGFVGSECVLSTALGGAKAGFDAKIVTDLTAQGKDQSFDYQTLPAAIKDKVKFVNAGEVKAGTTRAPKV